MILRLAGLALGLAAAGCSGISGTYPRNAPLLPAASLHLTQSTTLSLESIAGVAGAAALAYVVLDPLAPNWHIEEARLAPDRYALSLAMKRIAAGGEGEARVVFHRRAAQLAAASGYGGYEVLSYTEGIESQLPARRVGEGLVRLVRAPAGE
ncbi:MAG: hypothetical protein Fur0039_17550 [Rhodocyclaceae bacterium]